MARLLDWLLLVGGPFVLGVVAATIIESLTGKAVGLTFRHWFLVRARRRRLRIGRSGELLERGDEVLYIAQFVPGGWRAQDVSFQVLEHQPLDEALAQADARLLPAGAAELVDQVTAECRRLERFPDGEWNGPSLAVERVVVSGRTQEHEHPTLRVAVYPSEWAAVQVCTGVWQERFDQSESFRRRIKAAPQIIPGLVHAVGINATLVTDDEQLVIVRRSAAISSGRSGLHISVNEGMQPTDTDLEGRLDARHGLVRGVEEELGLTITARQVVLHSAIMDLRRYHCGLLGHIDLRDSGITAADLLAARQLALAKDRFENTELRLVPWRYPDVLALLHEPGWIAHGWLNLLLSAISTWGRRSPDLLRLLGDDRRV